MPQCAGIREFSGERCESPPKIGERYCYHPTPSTCGASASANASARRNGRPVATQGALHDVQVLPDGGL